jgi:hypothetical protein
VSCSACVVRQQVSKISLSFPVGRSMSAARVTLLQEPSVLAPTTATSHTGTYHHPHPSPSPHQQPQPGLIPQTTCDRKLDAWPQAPFARFLVATPMESRSPGTKRTGPMSVSCVLQPYNVQLRNRLDARSSQAAVDQDVGPGGCREARQPHPQGWPGKPTTPRAERWGRHDSTRDVVPRVARSSIAV